MWTVSAWPVSSTGGGSAETSTLVSVPLKPAALRAPVASALTPSGSPNQSRANTTATRMSSWIRQDRIRFDGLPRRLAAAAYAWSSVR